MATPTTPRTARPSDGLPDRRAIGKRVRDLRLAMGGLEGRTISQEELANRAGLTLLTINKIENGHSFPTVTTLAKIARAFGVPPGLLIEGE